MDATVCLMDTTCLEANVHHPVDWLLLKDIGVTLLKAVGLIRREGLVCRIARRSGTGVAGLESSVHGDDPFAAEEGRRKNPQTGAQEDEGTDRAHRRARPQAPRPARLGRCLHPVDFAGGGEHRRPHRRPPGPAARSGPAGARAHDRRSSG